MRRPILALLVLGAIILTVVGSTVYSNRFAPRPETSSYPPTIVSDELPPSGANGAAAPSSSRETVATGLDTPWTIAFLPTGEMIVSERKGTIKVFGAQPRTLTIPNVVESGESGLTGLALHPSFSSNQFLYAYFTTKSNGRNVNRVVRYRFDGTSLLEPVTIVDAIPSGQSHNGGQIAFGPDGKLYICTGDSGTSGLAQNKASLGGKILRVNDDGSIPQGNPFGTAVYTYGHRNPQGIVWDDRRRLWATEHGRSGLSTGYDEINLIVKGRNYGWPTIQGSATKEGMVAPVAQSGSVTTWAPAGIAFRDGSLYFAGLRGQAMYVMPIDTEGEPSTIRALFKEEYGRLRAVAVGPDGAIYFSTSNKDGRGTAKAGDDRIVRWMP